MWQLSELVLVDLSRVPAQTAIASDLRQKGGIFPNLGTLTK